MSLADFRLLLQAAETEDRELTTNLLSGRDRAWAAQQRARVATGALLQEPGLGLVAVETADPSPAVSWLAPALDEATVVITRPSPCRTRRRRACWRVAGSTGAGMGAGSMRRRATRPNIGDRAGSASSAT